MVSISYSYHSLIEQLEAGMNIGDVLKPTPALWILHIDPILLRDGVATTLLTIQYNLFLGTLAKFIRQTEDLSQLTEDLLTFKTLGQFCLTELGRGLDIYNMRTTATRLDSGDFDLHTPTQQDAKSVKN
ncbi:hypothetical protein M422DRAFT_170001 [Sphaerobolus stellatus SS14]|uniref:Unplaced genomic scaffold SPHSTscaffold_48, whole genome shotgun sequence n=1 Tax=Sphaerobolus stellatus (strain SS14) TaxID=990650 RepID=A0A0C9VYA2_SPHS4|nr:hypothetical protein M422DRAFT_170001 [Sphaerobolus stellatus SS14]